MATRIQTVCVFVKQWLQETYDGFEGDWDPSLLKSYIQEFHEYHSAMKRSEFINISRELQKYFNWEALYDDMEANNEANYFSVCPLSLEVIVNNFYFTECGFPVENECWVLEENQIEHIRTEIKNTQSDCSDSCDCVEPAGVMAV